MSVPDVGAGAYNSPCSRSSRLSGPTARVAAAPRQCARRRAREAPPPPPLRGPPKSFQLPTVSEIHNTPALRCSTAPISDASFPPRYDSFESRPRIDWRLRPLTRRPGRGRRAPELTSCKQRPAKTVPLGPAAATCIAMAGRERRGPRGADSDGRSFPPSTLRNTRRE